MSLKINLIKVRSTFEINFYTGSIRLGDLLNVFDVPIYRPQASKITGIGNGYQREPKPSRVSDVAKESQHLFREPASQIKKLLLII